MPRRRKYKRRRRRRKATKMDYSNIRLAARANVVTQTIGGSTPPLGVVNGVCHFRTLSFAYVQNFYGTAKGFVALNNQAKVKDLYDEYRVNAVLLEYDPYYSQSTFATAGGDQSSVFQILADLDDVGPSVSVDVVARRNIQTKPVTSPWKFFFKIPKSQQQTSQPGGPQGENGGNSLGWLNCQSEQLNLSGIISITTTNVTSSLPEGTALGSLKITYYVTLRGRQDRNTTQYHGIDPNTLERFPAGRTGPQDAHGVYDSINFAGITGPIGHDGIENNLDLLFPPV